MKFSLRDGVYLVDGAKYACLYDTANGLLYHMLLENSRNYFLGGDENLYDSEIVPSDK